MSTHEVKVVKVGQIEKHPNADSLGLTKIFGGYTAIVRLGDINEGDLCVYIEPDYVVPETEEWSFLKGHNRIKAKRLRGVWSQGLLVKAKEGMCEGDNVMELMGITRYEPSMKFFYGSAKQPTSAVSHILKYDVEPLRKHLFMFTPGEEVVATEKIHGANARYFFDGEEMWCGSRTQWRKPEEGDLWWRCLEENLWIEKICREYAGYTIYGEVFGQVQDLKYGSKPGDVFFRCFDIMRPDMSFMDYDVAQNIVGVDNYVPVVYKGPFDFEKLEELSRMNSVLANNQIAEGIVVRPVKERVDAHNGRVVLKLVSDKYLERS